jgi:hypothetical protein
MKSRPSTSSILVNICFDTEVRRFELHVIYNDESDCCFHAGLMSHHQDTYNYVVSLCLPMI